VVYKRRSGILGCFKKTALTVIFAALALPLCARAVEIVIEDIDLGLPLEGAVIRSWDGSEYVCDENGKARIAVPDDRPVTIQAAYPGYESGRLVIAEPGNFTLGLRLSGIMEGRELVIEASRPGTSETRTGRSIAVTERQIAQTGEIGLIEDVMTTIKLLPGVGYTGMFNALPSIRGGEPGDMSASLDGYYIDNPYHWGGGFSIFDPRMVRSAQLSHGVFSTRYGHTISGLLEVSAKKPSPTETEFEIGANTSAANFNLSLPLGRGGVLFMGRVTYYDPVVALAKEMAKGIPELEVINAVRVAPYIRSGAITFDWRFLDNLELQSTAFWGMDGIGVSYKNGPETVGGLTSGSDMFFDYANYQGFITGGLSWNPRSDMLLKTTLGTGYHQGKIDADIRSYVSKEFSSDFTTQYPFVGPPGSQYEFEPKNLVKEDALNITAQGRLDYDWSLGEGTLFAAGAQEMFNNFTDSADINIHMESWFNALSPDDQALVSQQLNPPSPLSPLPQSFYDSLRVIYPAAYTTRVENRLFSTSAYALMEYGNPANPFGAELGLRLDHFFLAGKGYSASTTPVLNPRLNLDFNAFKDRGIFRSLDFSAGTGLFSSINDLVTMADERYDLDGKKPARSWTTVLGTKMDFTGGLTFNIEGYYKYVFDRAYILIDSDGGNISPDPYTDGEGRIAGFDLMLQKHQSRFWDGWISYSFNWAKYRDPHGGRGTGFSGGNRGDDWYFPSYHRFHNLNLVLNIKPVPTINFYTRFGVASGTQLAKIVGDITSYPVYVLEEGMFIEKYYRATEPDENNRTTPSLPLDFKFSILGGNEAGKSRYEVYVALENALALLYTAQGNTTFNAYTGKEDTGSNSASYELPIPIPSFGFKLSY
jgi:hypothetical protein